MTSQTACPPGKFIGTLKLHGNLAATLQIDQGIFPVPVQITITEPYGQNGDCQGNADIGCVGFAGYRALGGVGIIVQQGGSAYPGTFGRPLALRLASPLISRSSLLVVWDGRKFVKAPGAVVRSKAATVKVDASSDYAVLVQDRDSCLQDASAVSPQAAVVTPRTLAAIFLRARRLVTIRLRRGGSCAVKAAGARGWGASPGQPANDPEGIQAMADTRRAMAAVALLSAGLVLTACSAGASAPKVPDVAKPQVVPERILPGPKDLIAAGEPQPDGKVWALAGSPNHGAF